MTDLGVWMMARPKEYALESRQHDIEGVFGVTTDTIGPQRGEPIYDHGDDYGKRLRSADAYPDYGFYPMAAAAGTR